MSSTNFSDLDSRYADLLNPIRDPTRSWNIDIADLLRTYIKDHVGGRSAPNFAAAALLIQGSSSIYGKKVEYLYNLVSQLVHRLNHEKRAPSATNEATKDKDLVPSRNYDFLPVNDIKKCKNLDLIDDDSCHNKAVVKYLPFVPLDLIPLEDSEKGDINLLDSRGEVLGNKRDFFLNVCTMHHSGNLLLPTVYLTSAPDDSDDILPYRNDTEKDHSDIELEGCEVDDHDSFHGGDGFESPPPTSNSLDKVPSPSERTDNLPVNEAIISNVAQRRRSLRNAAKANQLEESEQEKQNAWSLHKQEMSTAKKEIQKKNVRKLPKKLKKNPVLDPMEKEANLNSTSEFCAQTFFSLDSKLPKNGIAKNGVEAFGELFLENVQKQNQDLKDCNKKLDLNGEDEQNENILESENQDAVDSDNDIGATPFDDEEFPISQCSDIPDIEETPNILDELPVVSNYEDLVRKHIEEYMKDVGQYSQTTEISENVRKWEENIKPVLEEQSDHEPFDIHVYGNRILEIFLDNNRKQTVLFRDFCKNKEKWQVHRYFLASLQLANNYNIEISTNDQVDGSHIELTLLSRKQHHEELAEFGHNGGVHDP